MWVYYTTWLITGWCGINWLKATVGIKLADYLKKIIKEGQQLVERALSYNNGKSEVLWFDGSEAVLKEWNESFKTTGENEAIYRLRLNSKIGSS